MPTFLVFTAGIQYLSIVGFPPDLSSHFLNFDVLVMTSLITFTFTSTTIYVRPPQLFFLDRISPTTILP